MPFTKTNVASVKRRALTTSAIKFTGKNSKEVAEFVRPFEGVKARAGGSYVTITVEDQILRARKGDIVVIDVDGSIRVYTEEFFNVLFLPSSK